MGITTDPIIDEYSEEDDDFWVTGRTPKYIYISFTGICHTDPFLDPYNANKIIRLEQIAPFPFLWAWGADLDFCYCTLGPDDTTIAYMRTPLLFMFRNTVPSPHTWAMECGVKDPFDSYWGGNAQISWRVPSYCPSIAGAQEQLVIPRADHVMAEFWPLEKKAFIIRLASLRLSMRLHIKFDWTHFHQYNLLER